MGLQKYRADKADPPCENGSVGWRTEWQFGPSLALVRKCPIDEDGISPRTVYVTGDPDLWFSQPGVCQIKGKRRKGALMHDDDGYHFYPFKTP